MVFLRICVTLLACVALVVDAIDPIVIKGSHFFYKTNGTEFFIRGVVYQQDTSNSTTFLDPLAESSNCQRDVPFLQQLGVNLIRVYTIDSSLDHSTCMSLLASADIYVISDLSTPTASIDRTAPSWNVDLYTSYTAIVDSLARYDNVLGFFAGEEVVNETNDTDASAFVKASVRDIKAYIKAKSYRQIPVGYSSNSDSNILNGVVDYLNCGNSSDSIDFFGLNNYAWCGDSTFTESGYDQITAAFANYSVPAFFSEYGCNTVKPRKFSEVSALYGSEMTGVWSGGIAYEYFEELNDFGLVTVAGSQVSALGDYSSLSSQLAKATPSLTAASAYVVTNTVAQNCPTVGDSWEASSTLPPSANPDLCHCMVQSLSCVPEPGLNANQVASIIQTVCGSGDCSEITADAQTGTYGSYSMCNVSQKLGWALDNYYVAANKNPTACDFSGLAKTQISNVSSSCKQILHPSSSISSSTTSPIASSVSTGSVTTSPSGTLSHSISPSSEPAGTGLSAGALAGVVIGAIVLTALFIGFLFFLWRRRRNKNKTPLDPNGLEVGPGNPNYTGPRPVELPTGTHTEKAELANRGGIGQLQAKQELQAPSSPARRELEASRPAHLADVARFNIPPNTSPSELSSSPRPAGAQAATTATTPTQPISRRPVGSPRATWSNTPWADPGSEAFRPSYPLEPAAGAGDGHPSDAPAPSRTVAATAEQQANLPAEQRALSTAAAAEVARLEEEERRIDEAIEEAERLRLLKEEKTALRNRLAEARAKAEMEGGGSGAGAGARGSSSGEMAG